MRLIDADELSNSALKSKGVHDSLLLLKMQLLINDVPDADPSRHCYFEKYRKELDYFSNIDCRTRRCTACRSKVEVPVFEVYNYCPKCGAKIEVKK